eukprot:4948111-Lingulodinium_polyedra.AAC.1
MAEARAVPRPSALQGGPGRRAPRGQLRPAIRTWAAGRRPWLPSGRCSPCRCCAGAGGRTPAATGPCTCPWSRTSAARRATAASSRGAGC